MELSSLSGVAIASLIKSGELSAVAVMQQTLERADAMQAQFKPFVTLCHAQALSQAQQADETLRNARGEILPDFFGVPFTVKDLLDTQGVRTTYGSQALMNNVPTSDVVAVARMRAAGAILIGKTTTPEFAIKVTTDSEVSGITRNPWEPNLSAGGSSGGAGVAAATGISPLAVSTDGGGSARIPAAVCGILGMKVTVGAIPHESWPFHFGNNSSISMNCRHVEDLVALFNVMAGAHHLDPWSRRSVSLLNLPGNRAEAVKGSKALFIPAIGSNTADADYLAVVERALVRFGELGIEVDVVDDDPTHFDPGIATQMIVCNLAARVRQLPGDQQAQLGSLLQSLLDEEKFKPDGVRLQKDAISRSKTYDRVERLLGSYDFILSPTLTAPPPLADPSATQEIVVNGNSRRLDQWWSHLSLANMTGHPAISIPCGKDTNGLPVGLHALAGWDQEQALINLASAMSSLEDWSQWPLPVSTH